MCLGAIKRRGHKAIFVIVVVGPWSGPRHDMKIEIGSLMKKSPTFDVGCNDML